MDSTSVKNSSDDQSNISKKGENYIEIEIPYTLFQYLSTENCNVQNICRICLSTNNEILYPLVSSTENSFLNDMYKKITSVQPVSNDGLPESICEQCQSLLVQYYEFKVKCEKSDCMLRSILKGEFITKEEPSDDNIAIKEETKTEIKEEKEIVQDVEYLEDFSNEENEDGKLCIVQDTSKRKRKSLKVGSKEKCSKNEFDSEKIQSGKVQKSYTCTHCSKVFFKAKTYKMHVKRKHGINVSDNKHPHSCKQCKETFNCEHDLFVHSALHAKGVLWVCNQCHKEFNTKARLRRHIHRHMQFKRHSCGACDKTFTELYALRRHARVHTGERVEKKHACHICDKRYSDAGLLSAHLSRHSGLRPCECGACGARFPSRRLLASHARVHSDRKPHACSYCDKRFRHESTRNTHHRTHTGEKPYVCSVCGKTFIQNSNLTLHMRTHTGERPYACSVCSRKFSSGSSLKSHERVHTGERPYSCHVCGKKFARMSLGAHMRQHTDERPFACTACPKKFVNASRLRDHCRIHTGEKPYECAYCTFTFATKSHLAKHMKTHDQSKKKHSKRKLVIMEEAPSIADVPTNDDVSDKDNELVTVTENTMDENIDRNITLDIVQEVPVEVTGELILQDESNMKTELLVVDNSQNNYQVTAGNVNIMENINGDMNYGGDLNLVTVNEGGVSISATGLDGATVKLYQLDQSLVQIHSSGGQVTISKITSKMTANF